MINRLLGGKNKQPTKLEIRDIDPDKFLIKPSLNFELQANLAQQTTGEKFRLIGTQLPDGTVQIDKYEIMPSGERRSS